MTRTTFSFASVGDSIRFGIGKCSLGFVLVVVSERGICALFLGDEPDILIDELRSCFPHARPFDENRECKNLLAHVAGFVEAPFLGLDLPLDVHGTLFQQRVWQALCKIPAGATVSYAEIAKRIGAPNGAYAVGQACASNVIAGALPCHRVVRKDGALAGYRWGLTRKRALLEREAQSRAPGGSDDLIEKYRRANRND